MNRKNTYRSTVFILFFLWRAICVHSQSDLPVDSLIEKASYFYSHDKLDSSLHYFRIVSEDSDPVNKIKGITGEMQVGIFRNDVRQVESLIYKGDKIRKDLLYSKAVAQYDIMKGEYLRQNSRYREALKLHLSTAEKTETLRDSRLIYGDVMLYIALTYERMSRYDSSLYYGEKAFDIFTAEMDTTSTKFGTIANSLGVCFYRSNQYERARQLYHTAKHIAENNIGPVSSDLANVYSNLAAIESDVSNYENAIAYAENALNIYRIIGDEEGMSSGYYSLGVYYYYQGDYGRAKDYLEACIEIRERIFHPLHSRLIWPYQVLGIIMQEDGNYKMTSAFNDKSRQILVANYGSGSIEEGMLYENIATAFLNYGNPDSALYYIKRSSEILLKKLSVKDYRRSIHYFSLANVHYHLDQFEEARQFLLKSNTIMDGLNANNETDYAQNLALLAQVEWALNQPDDADRYFARSLEMIKNESGFIFSPAAFYILRSYIHYNYDRYRKTGDERYLRSFEVHSSEYLDMANKYRRQFNDPFTKSALVRNNTSFYRNNIGIFNQLYRQTGRPEYLRSAYSYSEYNRTAILRDMLDNKIRHFAGLSDSLLVEEVRLQNEITELSQQNLAFPDSANIKKSLFRKKEDLNRHIEKILDTNPKYYELKYSTDQMTLAEIQKRLVAGENLIEFMQDDTAFYALLITPETEDLLYLGNKKDIDDNLLNYRKSLVSQNFNQTLNYGAALYKKVFRPLEKSLKGERISIVPTGSLFYLNFEGLNRNQRPDSYLIYDYNISYALSIHALFSDNFKKQRSSSGLAMAIAPGFEDDIKESYVKELDTVAIVDQDFMHTLRQPWTRKLADKLKKEYINASFTGVEANEKNIKSNIYRGSILYFGTHAITNPTDPLRSKLVLAKEIGDQNEDGYLHAYELYGLPLQADLAILSACESGIGHLQEGEGMISLAYSLHYAGCPSTIMSLWKIDEKTNTLITDAFMENLAAGQSRSDALRNAKLDYLAHQDRALSHPYYWSGMVLMGQDGSVQLTKSRTYMTVLLMALGCLILLLLGIWYSSKISGKKARLQK